MDSSEVSFQLSYSSSLVAPDLPSSTFWLHRMLAARMSIGLKPSGREPTATPTVLKSLTQAREQSSGKRDTRRALIPWRGGAAEQRDELAAVYHSIARSAEERQRRNREAQ